MCTVFVAPPMGFGVLFCLFVSALTPVCSSHISREVRYECGPHGKFEYCIDDVPGCVIGCHCHPGYYFDTDSKICELNVKLTQNFRQPYFAEPTPTATAYPAPTTPAYNDDKVHEIPKDTDELGDWLYNQFFKTIETQVINNSNNTKPTNEKPPTRRSGAEPVIKKSKRKPRKSVRGRKKRKHMKERGLRKKLLRITEDDSLFDSDSDSDSDYSGSSSSDSDSSNDDDDSADIDSGSDTQKNPDAESCDDKDHGHKKVIIFNRRPKPPLPSFIFLPNMDTSYYPPIGLPPPPLVPMYPMVPVPPMAPPMFPPFPGPPHCGDESSKTTTTGEQPTTTAATDPTATSTNTTAQSTTETTTESTPESTTETTTEGSTTEGDRRRKRPGKHRKRPNLEKFISQASRPGKQRKLKHGQQSMLMQKIRDKLKAKRRNSESPSDAKSVEDLQDDDLQNSDEFPNISEDYTPHKRSRHEDQEENNIPKLEDVDFKYLSELIHRVNQSKSRRKPHLPFDLNEDFKELQKLQLSQPTRRNIGSHNPIPQVHQGSMTDDIFYSNLGKQIASMIRKADSNFDQQFSKNSEHTNRQIPFHSVLNENIHAPETFWERSVRSPVLHNGPLSEYLDESRTLKHSNEKSLINLENAVEVFATTPSPLSLQDLENILNTMQKAHAEIKFKQPMMSTKQSNVSMNVNLLPKHVRASPFSRIFDVPEKAEYVTQHYQTPLPPRLFIEMHPAVVRNASVFHEPERKYNVPYSDYWIYSPEPIKPKISPRPVIAQTSKPIMRDSQVYNKNPIRQPFVGVVLPKHTETKKSHLGYSQFLNNRPHFKQATSKSLEPKVVKYKSLNYFSGNKHYMLEAASYPLLLPVKPQSSKRVHNQPSFFHQQSHHFEYFD